MPKRKCTFWCFIIHYSFSQLFPKILFPLSLADIRGWHIFWARVEWSQTEAAVQHDEGVPGELRLRVGSSVGAVTMMTSSCCPLSGSTASGGRTPTSRTRSRSPSRPWPSPTTTCGCTGPRRSSTWWSMCRYRDKEEWLMILLLAHEDFTITDNALTSIWAIWLA